MTTWLTVVAAGLGCYLLRISLVAAMGEREPSPNFVRMAHHVMPAAFAALAATSLLHTAEGGAGHSTAPVVGAAVTATVASRASSTTALIAGITATAVVAATLAPL
jgi:branched-subunit amino acid transport protein